MREPLFFYCYFASAKSSPELIVAFIRSRPRGGRLLRSVMILAVLACGCDTTPSDSIENGSPPIKDQTSSNVVDHQPDSLSQESRDVLRSPNADNDAIDGLHSIPSAHIRFEDVHAEAGLDFVFDNGYSQARLMIESTAGGAGWLDYDGDGRWDLFLPQGGNQFTENEPKRSAADQLFRNMPGGTFVPTADQAGIQDSNFGHGVAVGDYDNDGFDDIYVTNVGPDILYHNRGDGTFENVTADAGIDSPLWGTSAAWADLDLDGDLDLYVCNYVDYDPLNPISCLSEEGEPGICHPMEIGAVPNDFYENLGNGRFQNVADKWGLNAPGGKSLGIAIADFDGDGRPDVYVANDVSANHLYMNSGVAQFEERGVILGCAASEMGEFQASMGVGFGDYDGNGFCDLYLTHFTKDSNTLYANLGPAGFADATRATGLHHPTLKYLAFGTVMADFDYNGYQDIFIANGHIDDWRSRTGDLWQMPPQLMTFDGKKWNECGQDAGTYFQAMWLGRAVASADYDNDGDLDLAVVHQNAPLGLLRNDSETGHWIKVRFVGTRSNRRGIGVRVEIAQGTRRWVQQLAGGTSYCASHQPELFVGLGPADEPCQISVRWPSGQRDVLNQVLVDQSFVLREPPAGG